MTREQQRLTDYLGHIREAIEHIYPHAEGLIPFPASHVSLAG